MFAKNDHFYRDGQVTQEVAEVILFLLRIFLLSIGYMKLLIGLVSLMKDKIRGDFTPRRSTSKS
jgi:hypothetical protein